VCLDLNLWFVGDHGAARADEAADGKVGSSGGVEVGADLVGELSIAERSDLAIVSLEGMAWQWGSVGVECSCWLQWGHQCLLMNKLRLVCNGCDRYLMLAWPKPFTGKDFE
jgi:hypothetical protein